MQGYETSPLTSSSENDDGSLPPLTEADSDAESDDDDDDETSDYRTSQAELG
jgi:hypothetical protein